MFNCKRAIGLVFLTSIASLIGCGGGDANQDPLQTCDDGQVLDGGVCVDRPLSCPTGEVLDDDTGECVPLPFGGPVPIYQPEADEAVIYYNRQTSDQDYEGWTLYQWNDPICTGWPDDTPSLGAWPGVATPNGSDFAGQPAPDGALLDVVPPSGVDPLYGAFWVVQVRPDVIGGCGNYIINDNGQSQQTSNSLIQLDGEGPFARMAFVVVPDTGLLGNFQIAGSTVPVCPGFDLGVEPPDFGDCTPPAPAARRVTNASAHWIDVNTLVWAGVSGEATDAALYSSSTGGISQNQDGDLVAGEGGDISLVGNMTVTTLTSEQAARVPHLSGEDYTAFTIAGVTAESAKEALKGQLLAITTDGLNADNEINLIGTAVQTARVLDAIYTTGDNDADEAQLGLSYDDGNIHAAVWAPTAQRVRIKLYGSDITGTGVRILNAIEEMTLDPNTGVWRFSGAPALDDSFYLYELQLYDPVQGIVVLIDSTDPYSVSLSTDSLYSQFVDINAESLKPAGWDSHEIPAIDSPESAVIYEGHVRDFSIRDASTPEANRGKYLAFTEDSVPVQHLQELASNGLTHFHILPSFDIASVVEAEAFQINLTDPIGELCALGLSSDIDDICDNANASDLIIDVLSGFDPTTDDSKTLVSVLQRVDGFNWGYDPYHFNVPEGSYASDPEGTARIVEMRSMIQALHGMGLRVVMDVVYNHTTASGFNIKSTFDRIVPGYYHRRDPIAGGVERASCCDDTASENRMMAKFMVESLVLWAQAYKIDGFRFDLMGFHPRDVVTEALAAVRTVDEDNYFYGEGWEEIGGSSANDAIFPRATQENLGGTGIGTFNDIMRDPLRDTVLFNQGNVDRVRLGLAGNLADFEFYNSGGQLIAGSDIGGYTQDPQENVTYVTKHDNETLWDILNARGGLPGAMTMGDRARLQNAALSAVLLSQGVPFIHMGADLLRSKSLDRNTFNAGDWYNYVDFTQTDNNWNVGQPIEISDGVDTSIVSNAEMDPSAATIAFASDVFNEFLSISASSPLFDLATGQSVMDRVGFHNQGVLQTDGLIVMSIDDGDTPASLFADNDAVELSEDIDLADLDPTLDAIVVLFNGTEETLTHTVDTASGFVLHATQASGVDEVVKTAAFADGEFTVPGLTTAIFVKPQGETQGYGLYAGASPAAGGDIPNPFGAGTALYVRGLNGDWGTTNEAEYDLAGNFTAFVDLPSGSDQQFKVANDDWSTQFTVASEVMIGTDMTMIDGDGQDNASLAIPADEGGVYRFNINAVDPGAPVLNVSPAESFGGTPIYARGLFGDWGTTRELAYQGESTYSGVFNLAAGDTVLKIADADWGGDPGNTGINYGVPDDVGRYTAGDGALVLNNANGSNGDIEITIPVTGDYLIKLDARTPLMPILSIVLEEPFAAAPIYVRGINGDWSAAPERQMAFQGNAVYNVDITIDESATERFKIADEDWGGGTLNTGFNWGSNDRVNFGEAVIFSGAGGDAIIEFATTGAGNEEDEDGDYTFTLDFSGGRLKVSVEPSVP